MVILSYVSLVLCVHFYAVYVVSLLEMFVLHQEGRSEIQIWLGHAMLVGCVLSGSYFGWTF